MKVFGLILLWMVVATDILMKIAAFLFWTLAAGLFTWAFVGAIRDLYKQIRVKFLPVDQLDRHAA